MKAIKICIAAAAFALAGLSSASAESTVVAPGQFTTGTYMDYMKTVYARATFAELLQVPLTSFDKDYKLAGLGAESWSQSEDGLTWTFKLRDGLVWSDGEPLTAEDYVFALQRAATAGYDFAWYWDFAGGIKNWKEVTEGKADVSTLGLKAVDDKTIEVTTDGAQALYAERRQPLVPGAQAPVRQVRRRLGDQRRHRRLLRPVHAEELGEVEQLRRPGQEPEPTPAPGRPQVDELDVDPTLGAPEVGMPAFLAGDADFTYLNAGQIPVLQQQFPDGIRTQRGVRDVLHLVRPRSRAVRQRRCAPRLLLRRQPRRADLDRAQGHRHPGRLDPSARLSRLQCRDRRQQAVFDPAEGQGVHGQGRLSRTAKASPRSRSGIARKAATTAPSSRRWRSTCRPSSRTSSASP